MLQSFGNIIARLTRQLPVMEMNGLFTESILRVNTDQNSTQIDVTQHKAQHEVKHESCF